MTRDEAIRLAEEAGWKGPKDNVTFVAILQAYANLVAAYEREECAKIAESADDMLLDNTFEGVAKAIRARGLHDMNRIAEQNGEEL